VREMQAGFESLRQELASYEGIFRNYAQYSSTL
jgi:hypothetical protein